MQSFNTENLTKIKETSEQLGELSPSIRKAIDKVDELQAQVNAPKFTNTVKNYSEGAEEMCKTCDEFAEALGKYYTYYHNIAVATGLA